MSATPRDTVMSGLKKSQRPAFAALVGAIWTGITTTVAGMTDSVWIPIWQARWPVCAFVSEEAV
jgi:hypothetical protein